MSKLIESVREFESLRIVDINRSIQKYGSMPHMGYVRALEGIAKFFVEKFVYTWHTFNPDEYPVRKDCPKITHPGAARKYEMLSGCLKDFTRHEQMGREYHSWFKANHPDGEIEFAMAPDFRGRLADGTHFVGDFGQVGWPTLIRTFMDVRMVPGALWITVPETGKHLILECQINMSEYVQAVHLAEFDKPKRPKTGLTVVRQIHKQPDVQIITLCA